MDDWPYRSGPRELLVSARGSRQEIGHGGEGIRAVEGLVVIRITGQALIVDTELCRVRAADDGEVVHNLVAIVARGKSHVSPGPRRRGSIRCSIGDSNLRTAALIDAGTKIMGE